MIGTYAAGNVARRWARIAMRLAVAWLLLVCPAEADERKAADERTITLVVRDAEVAEVFEMLARNEGVNIVMSDDISGKISVSLFDVPLDEAIDTIAQAAGFGIEKRNGRYVMLEFDEVGKDHTGGSTIVRSFKIYYSEVDKVREIVEKHLSRYGEITALAERNMLVVEDLPVFVERAQEILREVDREPSQILLEAKVLEVILDDSDTLGIDWSRVAEIGGSDFTIGLRGLTSGTAPGLFFNVMNENLEGAIEALRTEERVRALASPRLLTMEHQEAEVLVGQRQGYRVTTTINQVTTESVEFIDSGVILRFTPSVDRDGRVLLQIHPEVSTGKIDGNGIPELTTTEVTTQLLADDGEQIFIAGLIRDKITENMTGVPGLSRIPLLGMLFSRSEWVEESTETIVIVRATVRNPDHARLVDGEQVKRLGEFEPTIREHRKKRENDRDLYPWKPEIGSRDEDGARETDDASSPWSMLDPRSTPASRAPDAQ